MKITVIGPGAIGTLLAALLSNTNVEISLLVKPKHKELLRDEKIVLNNFKGKRLEKKIKIITKLESKSDLIVPYLWIENEMISARQKRECR